MEQKEIDYPVISICKNDLKHVFKGNEKRLHQIENLTDMEMKRFADDLQDGLFECGYWDACKSVFEACFPLVKKGDK